MKPRAVKVSIAKARPLPFLRAAHALTASAWVVVDKSARGWSAWLMPRPGALKGPPSGAPNVDLAKVFRAEYAAQEVRAGLEKSGRPLRAERLRRLLAADGSVEAPSAPSLPPERLAEIEALLAEEAADPAGIRTPWEELRGK